MQEHKYSTPSTLKDLEQVIKMRVPVWDVGRDGDFRVKLDTDTNGKDWYVITYGIDQGFDIQGAVSCWAFPHWNGAFTVYSYIPQGYCFETLAELLLQYPDDRAIWAYTEEEYEQYKRLQEIEQEEGEPSLQHSVGDRVFKLKHKVVAHGEELEIETEVTCTSADLAREYATTPIENKYFDPDDSGFQIIELSCTDVTEDVEKEARAFNALLAGVEIDL